MRVAPKWRGRPRPWLVDTPGFGVASLCAGGGWARSGRGARAGVTGVRLPGPSGRPRWVASIDRGWCVEGVLADYYPHLLS
jgi:hypothetical protein